MDDLFRPINEYPGYRVSINGGIQSSWTRRGGLCSIGGSWRPLQPIERHGYLTVNLTLGGGKKTALRIHRLVLEAFVGPCSEGMVCCHNDGNPSNNRLENLRFDTHKGNSDDAVRHGTKARGTALKSKLSEADVIEIRRLRAEGHTMRSLAERFCVSESNVKAILRGLSWRHLLPPEHPTTHITDRRERRGVTA